MAPRTSLLAALLTVSAGLARADPLPPTPGDIAVVEEGGQYVVRTDASSMPIYTYGRDPPDRSNCNDACAGLWPPVLASAGEHAIGDWTIVRRSDGADQWAFRHRPLYTYARDRPGAATGNGIGGEWRLLTLGPSN